MPKSFPAVILKRREPAVIHTDYNRRVRFPLLKLGQHFGYESLCIYFESPETENRIQLFPEQELFYDETGHVSQKPIVAKNDIRIMLDGSVAYCGPIQEGKMEHYYCETVSGSVFAMVNDLFTRICNYPTASISTLDLDSIEQILEAIFCGNEKRSQLTLWSEHLKNKPQKESYIRYTGMYHLDQPYGNRDYNALGIEGFTGRLLETYTIWTEALKDYDEGTYRQTLEKSGCNKPIDAFNWAVKELGIEPKLEALYAKVPLCDILA